MFHAKAYVNMLSPAHWHMNEKYEERNLHKRVNVDMRAGYAQKSITTIPQVKNFIKNDFTMQIDSI